MATSIRMTRHFAATPELLMDMMRDPEYWSVKYRETGATDVVMTAFSAQGEKLVVGNQRVVSVDIPAFARRVVGERIVVHQSERWTREGDAYVCDFRLAIEGVPGDMTGSMRIVPLDGTGSEWRLEFVVKARVPLMGAKLEQVMKGVTEELLNGEADFNAAWQERRAQG